MRMPMVSLQCSAIPIPHTLVGYCVTLHMEISVAKTKVMVVSRSPTESPVLEAAAFTCNGLPVGQVDTFKCLGLHFHLSGGTSHLITPLKAKAARSWAGCSKGIPNCNVATQSTSNSS